MKVSVRIYRQHDLDLIALYRNKKYHIGREMKKCLIAYAKGEMYVPPEVSMDDVISGYVPTYYVIHIELNDKKPDEAAAIELIKHIKNGYKCSFMKALFRSSILYLPLLAYSDDSGFITKRANPVTTINRIQAIAALSSDPISTEQEITGVDSNESVDSVPEEKPDPIIAPAVDERVAEPVVPETIESDNDDDDFDALFSAMDALSHV